MYNKTLNKIYKNYNYIVFVIILILILLIYYFLKNREYLCNILEYIQEDFESFKYYEETITSMNLVKNNVLKVNEIINKEFKDGNIIYPKFRIYTKRKFVKKPYAYTSILFKDETYLPGIITFGYSVKQTHTGYNLICMIQDKPYNDSPGVKKETINDLLNIYDVIYGIDYLEIPNYIPHSKNFTSRYKYHYNNISGYVTKSNVFGLLDYEKVFFCDSSTILTNNIDFVFNYNFDTFNYDKIINRTGLGLRGTFFLVKPSLFNYNKSIYLIKNYQNIFKTYFFLRGIDEVIIFYTVYPNWNEEYLPNDFNCDKIKTKNNSCSIIYYQINKPFKKNIYDNKQDDYKYWDEINQQLFFDYPKMKKYYSHIPSFRIPMIKNLYT
jgi:hypothetical protein